RLNPVEHGVAAVACIDERRRDPEQMRGEPRRHRSHRPAGPEARKRETGEEDQAAEDLRRRAVQREVHETETEGRARPRLPLHTLECVDRLDWNAWRHLGLQRAALVDTLRQRPARRVDRPITDRSDFGLELLTPDISGPYDPPVREDR